MIHKNYPDLPEGIRLDLEDHSYPDACISDWLEDEESHSHSDANVLEEPQRDMENISFALEEIQLDVEDHLHELHPVPVYRTC